MKQEIFKEMYDDIQLDREQRSRIWKQLETGNAKRGKTGNKWKKTAVAVVCACLILVISVPSVLAAKSTLLDSIMGAFDLFSNSNGTERNLTEEQTDVYEQYGKTINQKIALPHSKVNLEAMINDQHFLCIPFSVEIGEKIGAAGENIRNTPFFNHMLDDLTDDWSCYLGEGRNLPMGRYTSLNPAIQEDGKSLSGAFLLYETDKILKQGQVIHFRREDETDGKSGKAICNLTLNSPVNYKEMPTDVLQKQLPEGAVIDKITISPLSLNIEGKNVPYLFDSTVELNDGSIVETVDTGSSASYHKGKHSIMIIWKEPINIDEVKAIHCPKYPAIN